MPHRTLYVLSQCYSSLFCLCLGSVNIIITTTATQFLLSHDANISDRPLNSSAKHIAYNYQDLVFVPYGPCWCALRKLYSLHLFGAKVLNDLHGICEGEVALLVRALAARQGSPRLVNVGQADNMCVTNVLAQATVGRRVFEEEGDGVGDFKEMVMELMQVTWEFNVGDLGCVYLGE